MIQCVAFDMDDTLYDELDYYKSGLAAVASVMAEDYNLDETLVFSTLWAVFTGGNHKTTFNATLEELAISYDSDYIRKWVDVLRCHPPQITLPADSRAVLEGLKADYRLALITDGFLPAQKLKARALDIEKYFDFTVFTEELGRAFWKPSTAAFDKMLDEMALQPRQCVYVGDNLLKDFIAPNKLGCETVQVVRAAGLHKDPPADEAAAAKHVLQKLADLPVLLKKL